VDYGKKVGIVVKKSENLNLIQMAREMDVEDIAELAGSMDYTKLIKVEQLQVDDSSEPLRRQAEAFIQSVIHHRPPVVPARAGLAAIECALDIVRAAESHKWDGPGSTREGLDIIAGGR